MARTDTVHALISWFDPPDPPDPAKPEGRLQLALGKLALDQLRETGNGLVWGEHILQLGEENSMPV